MNHQLLPRHGHAPDADDCHALALYWDNEAMRPDANDQTVLVCLAEAKHWRDVANELERLTQATPVEYAEAEPERQRIERDMTERMLDDVEIFDGLDRAKARHVASGWPERPNDFPR